MPKEAVCAARREGARQLRAHQESAQKSGRYGRRAKEVAARNGHEAAQSQGPRQGPLAHRSGGDRGGAPAWEARRGRSDAPQ